MSDHHRGKANRAAAALAAALLGSAVVKELRKPRDERQWVGKVAGIFPYDLRRPTLQRVREAFWSPEDHHIFRPHAFGVGWTINLGRLARIVRHR